MNINKDKRRILILIINNNLNLLSGSEDFRTGSWETLLAKL